MSDSDPRVSPEPSVSPDPSPDTTAVFIDYTTAPQKRADRWAHRRGEPRVFAVFWIGFLMCASVITIGALGMMGLVAPDVYRPGARAMIAAAALGISIGWPMVRLSQVMPDRIVTSVTADLIVLLLPLQALLWPQCWKWMAAWPWQVVGSLCGVLCGSAALLGAMLVLAMRDIKKAESDSVAGARRAAWMMLVATAVSIGPVVGMIARRGSHELTLEDGNNWLLASPVTAVFEVARDRVWSGHAAFARASHYQAAAFWCLAALLTWVVVTATRKKSPASREISNPNQT